MTVLKFPTSRQSKRPVATLVVEKDGTITSAVSGARSAQQRVELAAAIQKTIIELLKRR
jgi:hypothetical protein